MTVLQLRGPMGFRALQWCHLMLVQARRTSYCTRMITIYGAQKWIQACTENSLHYLGESLNHVMQFQQNVNWNMVEHLNMTVKNQLLQGQALGQLVENTRQREFDKLFDLIPVYDGEDPEKFEPWLSKLESACLVGKRDVREVAICSSTGPVLEVLNSIEDKED